MVKYCALSPPARRAAPCARVNHACFDGEQIFLHGDHAELHRRQIYSVLAPAKDPWDNKKMLRPTEHEMVHVASPGALYTFLPLAVNAQKASQWLRSHNDSSAYQQRRQPMAASPWITNSTAVAFVTTFSNAWTEAFARAAASVFEEYCQYGGRVDIIPAVFGSTFEHDVDQAAIYLAPLTRTGRIEPMSLTPRPEPLQQAIFGNTRASPGRARCSSSTHASSTARGHSRGSGGSDDSECLSIHLRRSEEYFAARGQRCFANASVCAFHSQPRAARPWSLMQALAAHHAGPPPARNLGPRLLACASADGGGVHTADDEGLEREAEQETEAEAEAEQEAGRRGRCPLRVVYIRREGRRRLHNIDEHVAACNAWRSTRSADDPRPSCEAYTFGGGLVQALPLLRRTDVLIGPHGADMTNGLALHAGATVVELLPPTQKGCPCHMYQAQFASEPGRILHYTASTRNESHAVRASRPGTFGTYNADFVVDVEVTRRILERVVEVGGRHERWTRAARGFEY